MAYTAHPVGAGSPPCPRRLAGDRPAARRHLRLGRRGRTAGHHDADACSRLRSQCAPPAPRRRASSKVLAFAQDNEREFMQGVDHGLAMAAKDRGLEYRRALANNDAAKMVEQVQLLLASKVGAIVAAPVDPASLEPQPAGGDLVGRLCRHDRAAAGDVAAQRPAIRDRQAARRPAAAYINEKLGGKANVVLLTQDQIEFLAPRFAGDPRRAEGTCRA